MQPSHVQEQAIALAASLGDRGAHLASPRELARVWHSFLRLMKPSIDHPETCGGRMICDALRENYGAWLLIMLRVDGPGVCAGRLAKLGMPCPMDTTTPF